jgi:hypothetical protein
VLCEELKNLDRREFTVLCSGRSKNEKDEPVRIKVILNLQHEQAKPGRGSP